MSRGSRLAAGLLTEAAIVVGLALLALTVVLWNGEELRHDLRETLLRVTPGRALVAILALAVGFGAVSLVSRRRRPRAMDRGAQPPPVPVVALLGLIVVAASTFRLLLVQFATEPRVFGDELVYSGLAKGFALDGQPVLRGELDLAHSLLYPLLIAPAHVLAADGAQAFEATKAINTICVTSAAIPSYLLARRVVGPWPGLVVAALVAFAPWTAYASLVMTESLFLPVLTTFVLVFASMLERPDTRRQLAVLGGLVVLVAIRPQALVLAAAVLGAIGARALRAQEPARELRRHAVAVVGLCAAGLVAAIVLIAGARVPGSQASDAAEGLLDPAGLFTWAVRTLAVYELALGVVAVAAFPLALYGLLRSPSERARATGVALLATSVALFASAVVVSSSPAGLDILHERYVFALTPLVLVALAHWVRCGSPRPRVATAVLAAGAVALAAGLSAVQLERANNVDSPTAAWLQLLHTSHPGLPATLLAVGLAALGAAVLVRFRTPVAPFACVALAFAVLVSGLDYSGSFSKDQDRRLAWVDRALTRGTASLVHLGYSRPDQPCASAADREQQALVVWTEFFNTRVDRVFHVSEQVERDGLASPALSVGAGGVVLEDGEPFAPRFAALDSRQPVVGTRLARLDLAELGTQYQAGSSLTLWAVDPPLRFLPHAQPLAPRADGLAC